MDPIKWYAQQDFTPNWVNRVPDSQNRVIAPKPILGEEDAATEWAHQTSPEQLFSPIESYRELQQDDNLFLFGRRGTGKTALLRMLHYEISKGDKPRFVASSYLAPKEAIDELTTLCRGSYLSRLEKKERVHFFAKCWSWLLQAHALVAWRPTGYPRVSARDRKQPEDLTKALTRILARKFSKHIGRCSDITGLGARIIDFEDDLFDARHDRSLESLAGELEDDGQYVIVLVDTEEMYPVHDDVASSIRTALIDAVLQMYNRSEVDRILSKAAFPSEILPHMRPINREKTEGKSVVILWSYRDLVTMLAKRFLRIAGDGSDSVYDALSDYKEARAYLLEFFPESIKTRNGLWFDTIAYIIRHTQKKPRQALMLVNTILTLAESSGFELGEEEMGDAAIVDGIHERLDLLVKGSLDIYHDIYPFAERLVKAALTGARSYFSSSDLDKLLQSTNTLRSEGGFSKEEVRRLLLESGVVGVASAVHEFGEFRTQVVECLFEYQVKGVMNVPSGALCVIHPMFLGELRVVVDTSAFVYPRPFEDEEREVLRKVGLG